MIKQHQNVISLEECAELEHIVHKANRWYQAWLFNAYDRKQHHKQYMVWNWKLTTDDQTEQVFRHSTIDDINWSPDCHPIFIDVFNKVLALEPRATGVVRIGFNGQPSGDFSQCHIDQEDDYPTRSYVLYCNSEWHPDWGGETYFVKKESWDKLLLTGNYNIPKSDILESHKPEPGSCLSFNGRHPHGVMPTKINKLRLVYNIVFKLEY